MEVFKPIYHRPPNKFLKYKEFEKVDRAGNEYLMRVAFYKDKKGRVRRCTAQVIWKAHNAELSGSVANPLE